MFRKILFIADNHALMDTLLRYVPRLFPRAEYHVMGVVDLSPFFVNTTDFVHETVEAAVVGAVMHSNEVLASDGRDAKLGIVWGNFAARVGKYTLEKAIDLVAVETFMDEDTKRSHLSWHVDRLFRGTDRPILLMDRLPEDETPDELLLLLTAHPLSLRAGRTGIRLARYLGATCTALDITGDSGGSVERRLKEMASRARVPLRYTANPDARVKDILSIVAAHDMLVMTRGGKGLLDKMKMSVTGLPIRRKAYEVFAGAPTPALLVGEHEVIPNG